MAALVLAFAASLALRPGSAAWWAASGVLAAVFLCGYLFYLPARLRGFSLTFGGKNLVLSSGVFASCVRSVPLCSIQYVRRRSSPLHKRLDLCTLEAVCAGGRVAMPGLREGEAEELAAWIAEQLACDS